MDVLVSVIIPTYNRADCIERAIYSALGQTYQNLEVLVVDDMSTDNTEEVVRNISDDRVKYIKIQEKSGASGARNYGVSKAEGEIIAFLDSDDYWHVDKLQKQVNALITHGKKCGMVFCKYELLGELQGIFPEESDFDESEQGMTETLIGRNKIGAPTIVIRKDLFEKSGGFSNKLQTLEDWEFAIRLSLMTKIFYIPEVLVNAHSRRDGVNCISGTQRLDAELYIIEEFWKIISNKECFFTIMSSVRESISELNDDEYSFYLNKLLNILCDDESILSIVVPIYNVEKYLEECLESLVSLPIKKMEIICVNDGSTDGSLNIIRNFEKRDLRVKVIDKKNSGYGDSVNKGIEKAEGKYIGIVESDDFIETRNYVDLVVLALEYQLDMIKGNYDYYNTNTKAKETYRGVENIPNEELLHAEDRNGNIFFLAPSIWSAVYRKEYLEKNGIKFLRTPGASYQDTSFAFKTIACAERLMVSRKSVLNYRFNNNESSSNHSSKVFNIIAEYQELTRFIELKNLQHLYPYLVRARYLSYNWNAARLKKDIQIKFWYVVREEFERDSYTGRIWRVHWTNEEWLKINLLIFAFDKFVNRYIECDNEKVEERIKDKISPILVYGINPESFRISEVIENRGYKVDGFVTKDEIKYDTFFIEDKKVVKLSECKKDSIIVCSNSQLQEEVCQNGIVVNLDLFSN